MITKFSDGLGDSSHSTVKPPALARNDTMTIDTPDSDVWDLATVIDPGLLPRAAFR